MPSYSITAPNGKTYRMSGPAGLTQQDLIAHIMERDPDAGTPPPPPKTGLGAALQSGLEGAYTSTRAALKGAFGDTQAAAAEALAAQKEQERKYDPQVGLGRVADVYEKDGLLSAAGEVGRQIPRAIAGSLPEMGAALGGARLGAMAGTAVAGPLGGLVGGIGGGILGGFLPSTGRNLAQQQEQTPGQVSYGKAAAAGTAQAALEAVTPLALLGGRVAGKVFGKEAAAIAAKFGPEAAEEIAKRGLLRTVARGGAVGVAGEAGTEVLQDAIGRLQSGQALLDEDALKSYAESAYGGALAGGPLGGAGAAFDRSGAQTEVAGKRQAAEALAAQQLAQERAAQAQAAAEQDATRKADPGYAEDVGKRYALYEQQKKALLAQRAALLAEKTDAGKAAAKDIETALREHIAQGKPLWDEFNATRATRAARAALAAQQAPTDPNAPAAPAGALFGGYENEQTQQRVVQLQNTISEHEALMPRAQEQLLDIMRSGDSKLIAQARAGLGKREKEYADAQKELYKLAPDLQRQRVADEAAEVQAKQAQALDPAKVQKQIDALTEKLATVNDPSEAGKAQKWAAERERLQSLLTLRQEQLAAPAAEPAYAEDLFEQGDRLRREEKQSAVRQRGQEAGLEAAGRGEATQQWPSMDVNEQELPGTPYVETPEGKAVETDAAFGRTFAPEPRSGMQDIAGQRPARSADPLLTQAMEQAGEEPPAAPRAPAGRTFPGTAPSDLTATGKASDYALTEPGGQQRLFVPEKGPEVTPAAALRQRIGKLIATPKLTPQAKNELQRAADALDTKAVPQRVLENITALADRAEKGVGRHQIEPGVKAQRLEGEKIADAGPDADKQSDLFDTMHVGRATPKGFQRALDTGALPSKRGEKAAARHVEGLLTAGALLRSKAAGLRARVAAAAAARTRLAGVVKEYRDHTPAQRKALADTMHEKMADATKAALKSKDVAAKHAQQARELEELATGAAGEEAGPAREKHARQARKAAMAEQEALKQAGRVEEFKALRRAVTEADAAPAMEEAAARHDALAAELAGVEAEIATNDADLKARQGEVQAKRKKAGKEVAAPDVERKGPRLLPRQQERVKAPVPTEAERRTAAVNVGSAEYAARTGEKVTRVQAREAAPGLDITSDAVDDAVDTALAVTGVTKPELQQVFDRVRALTKKRAIDTRAGVVGKQVAVLADDMSRFRAAHPGGVIPGKHGKSYRSAVLEKAHLEARLKATSSADARAPILKRMDVVDKHIDYLNRQRVPHAEAVSYRDMQRRAALLEFERDVIEMQRNAVAAGEGYKALPQASVLARAEPGTVEPATKLGTEKPATRMALAKEAKAKSKYGFKNRAYSPTEESKEAAEDIKAKRSGEDAALKAASAAKVAKGKPAKLTPLQALKAMQEVAAKRTGATVSDAAVPKAISDMYEATDHTPLSEWQMERAHDGQLDKVLGAIETDGSTQPLRDLAKQVQAFVKNTKLVVTDKVGVDDAAASYDTATDTIKIHPLMLSEENLLHEVVHAATLRALAAPANTLSKEQLNARNELQSLLKRLQADPAFKREYGAENIAELASEVMTNQGLRDKINAQKPGLIRRFIDAVRQMLGIPRRAAAAKAQAHIEALFQPSRPFSKAEVAAMREMLGGTKVAAAARAATPPTAMGTFSSMLTAEPERRGVMGFLKDSNAGLAAEMALVDQRAPILKALSKGDQAAFQQAQYFLRKSDARMAQVYAVLQRGPAQLKKDAKGNHIVEAGNGPSAKQLFEEIGKLPGATAEEKYAKAQAYMVAQRAANKGWDKLGFETSEQTRAAGEQMMAEVKADPALKAKLDDVRKLYNDYNKGMVQFLADTGAISKETAQMLTKDGDYVPFYRVGNSGAAELVMGEGTHIRVGDVRKQPYLQQLKGDDSKLLPLNEAVMRNTMLLTDMGLSNLATKSIAYSMKEMGKERGPQDERTGKRTNLNVIHRQSDRPAPAGPDIIKFRQEPDKEGDNGERWMRVTSEGTPFEGIPAEMLVQSLEGTHTVLTGMGKLASRFGDVLRSGVTRTPMYMIRQLIRDPMSAAFTAGTSRGPIRATMETMREFVAQSRDKSEAGEALLRKGVAQSGIFTGDADDLGKFALQLAHGNQSAITRLASMADRAAMRADAATRAQVYDDTLKATGSEMQAEMAAMEMMNFTKRGSSPTVQHAARMIPFLNAQIQGLNVLAKAFRGNMPAEQALQIRSKFIKRAAGLTAMSMLYAMGMEDDEEYKAATAQDRFNNFFVPTPAGTIKVPIPYEVGLLFKALPEAAVRAMGDKMDATDWAALRSAAFNSVPGASSLGIPQMGKPAIEAMMNRNLYTGRDIETAEQQKLDPEMRYNENTTELAKGLGSLTGTSPLKIEHLVRGYLGGLPIAAASLANEVLSDTSTPDRRASQTPLLGGLLADPLARGAVDRAYAKAKAIEQAGATYDRLVKEGKYAAALKYREDNLGVLMAEPLNARFKSAAQNIAAQRARVLQSGLSAPEKRKHLDAIDKYRNEQADLFSSAVKAVATAQ